MWLTRWIDGCFSGARKRRRSVVPSRALERLESRQLLTADWNDAILVGPVYSNPQSDASNVSPVDAGNLDATPLPNDWLPRTLPASPPGTTLHPLTDLPVLNSYLASPINLYLDFNGHFQDEWSGDHDIETPAFSLDNDTSTFTDEELASMTEIFTRVSEDFAPFAINVTTVEPADIGDGTGIRIAIGGRWEDWFGSSAGGVGLIDSFTNDEPNVVYVFSETLDETANIAEACSHEAGHAFGLRHQSAYNDNGNRTDEYYGGDSTGAPIMGSSYFSTRGRWWLGTSTSAATIQDDLAILSRPENGFGYRPDDHGDTYDDATTLTFAGSRATSSGLIEQMDDVDVFRFDITTLDQYRIDYHATEFGANLDVHLELRGSDGTLIEQRTTSQNNTLALGRELGPGSYQVLVQSDGTYGSLGHYTLQVQQGNDPTLPPTAPGDFAATFLSPAAVHFTWVDAVGETSYVLHATRKVGRKTQTFSVTLPAESTEFTLTGHGPLSPWQFELEAINPVASVTTDTIPASFPPLTAPQNVTAIPFSATSLAILWDAVPGAETYLVRIRVASTPGTTLLMLTVDGSASETIVSNLEAGVDYLINVIARNGAEQASEAFITAQIPAEPVPDPLPPPTIATATASGPFDIHLNWSTSTGATLYQVQQKIGKTWTTVKIVAGAAHTADLVPDSYQPRSQYRVVASNGTLTATSKPAKVRRPPPAWGRK